MMYKVLLTVYGLFGEARYFLHAVLSGKLRAKIASSPWRRALSRQSIPYRAITADAGSLDQFRKWLDARGIRFLEGGWTIYLPPQEGMGSCFGFVENEYPPNAGLKILKNLQGPKTAKYTRHRQHPAPGVAIMRALTPSPVALIRIANYLYWKGLGNRIHDIIGLTCQDRTLTCYVVEHVDGKVTREEDYRAFMGRMQEVLNEGDLTTAHARVDIIEDLMPPDCNSNLRLRPADGRPLYVDFQGFLFRNEDRMIRQVLREVRPHVRFDLEELVEGRDPVWDVYSRMLDRAGCGLGGRLVMEIGCSPAFVAYEALAAGASWVLGWHSPGVRGHMEHLLLTLGATRFDMFDSTLRGREWTRDLPSRYGSGEKGVLFVGCGEQAGDEPVASSRPVWGLPWEYMVCEGPLEYVPGAELLDVQGWVDSHGTGKEARLFRRSPA